jgi:hypothetical protein
MTLAALTSVIDILWPNDALFALPFRLVVDALDVRRRRRGGVPAPDVMARVAVKCKHAVTTV